MLTKQIVNARRAGVPLVAVTTNDPAATTERIKAALDEVAATGKNGETEYALMRWDVARGLVGLNDNGVAAIATITEATSPEEQRDATRSPGPMLEAIAKAPRYSCVVMLNAHKFWTNEVVLQSIWNLRGAYKSDWRTLVMLCLDAATMPPELRHDVVVFDEPLPTRDDLAVVVNGIYKQAKLAKPDEAVLDKAVTALVGLPSFFCAEQVTALAISKKGVRLDSLWERKRVEINSTKGLSTWEGGETLDDIVGLENGKTFMKRTVLSKRGGYGGVFWIDELDKTAAGGVGGMDTSGVSQDQHKEILRWMEDNRVLGVMFVGPGGSGKSLLAKCTAAAAGLPTIAFDSGGVKDIYVGASEQHLRTALKTGLAVCGGRPLVIATCNRLSNISPEMRRRFPNLFYFDLMTATEGSACWEMYVKKFGLDAGEPLPESTDWTGAEIRNCCWLAWLHEISLVDAARYIVPVAVSAADEIAALRRMANGRFLAASAERMDKRGLYRMPGAAPEKEQGRKMTLAD